MMNRTTQRAAGLSLLLHSVLILLVISIREPLPLPERPPVMRVQLLRLDDLVRPQPAATQSDEGVAPVEPAEERATVPKPADTTPDPPAQAQRPVDTPAPPAMPPETLPAPAPDQQPAPESVAVHDVPAAEISTLAPKASTSGNEATLAPATAARPGVHTGPRPAAAPPVPVAVIAPPAAPPDPPRPVPIPEEEMRMLSSRFSDWTGKFDEEQPEETVSWRHDGREYTARLKRVPAADDMSAGRILVEISTEQGGTRLTMEMQMRQLSFSNFAQFVDRWNPAVQIHDDTVDGRFHSNSPISLTQSDGTAPVFNGLVTLAARSIDTDSDERLRREQLFRGGLKTGVRRITLPRHALPLSPDDSLKTDVHELAGPARLVFHDDGSYRWHYLEEEEPEERVRHIGPGGHYIIGPADGELRVSGVVRGRVLVYAPETIVIEDDLVYARYPPVAGDSGDYVGLVADVSIEVAEPEVTGTGDLAIHGSIYARRRFAVREYNTKQYATLLIYGSLAAGSVSATEPRFATRVEFDQRLEGMRPPGFPLTDRYELDGWDNEWKREPLEDADTTSL